MAEEIKEILDNIKSLANNHTDKYGIKLDGMRLRNYELKLINDYITNLQQDIANYVKITLHDRKEIDKLQKENERLKEELNYTVSQVQHNQIVTKLCKEKEDYKSRFEKAIEYIKNLSNKPNVFGHYGIDTRCKNWLLKILKGK